MAAMMDSNRCSLQPMFGGPVQTLRYTVCQGRPTAAGMTENAGIACYICELLCTAEELPLTADERRKWAGVLVEQISSQAIHYKGTTLWRWERTPQQADYLYAPDWDDTCKAIDALLAYEKRYSMKVELDLPSGEAIAALLASSVVRSTSIGEGVSISARSTLTLPMFMATREEKPNNVDDPFVTAVVLRCLCRNYCNAVAGNEDTILELFERLIEVAAVGIAEKLPFCVLSRCYLSWAHYLSLLWEIAIHYKKQELRIYQLVQMFFEANALWDTNMDFELERAYLDRLAANVGRSTGVWHNRGSNSWNGFGVMYQHRRLGHFFGSPIWLRLLMSSR